MDFGQLPRHRQFDPARAPLRFAARGPADRPLRLRVGAPQWTIPEWIGKLYPKGTKSGDFLAHYATRWNAIELNTSFYNIPPAERVREWAGKTPADFRFFVKVFQGISHDAGAWSDASILRARIDAFVKAWTVLEDRLGGLFLQLPPEFGPDRLGSFERMLAFWPQRIPLAVEFRHPAWFADRRLIASAHDVLRRADRGTVITDTPGRRDASHGTLTNDRLFVRFLGQSTIEDPAPLPIDLERIDSWADGVAKSRNAGLVEQAFFVHTPEHFWVPELAARFLARLRERGVDPGVAAPEAAQEPQLGLF